MFWNQVHQIDQQLTLTINSWHSTITDPIWAFFSDKIVWVPMYAAIIALLFWKLGWKKALIVIAGIGLTFGFCDQFSNLVKHAVARIRPLNDGFMLKHGLHVLEKGGGYSFFSAHAANAFGLACSTFIGLSVGLGRKNVWVKSYGIWMFLWATMVSVSRIFVGKHYLGDVIVGIIVGCMAGLAFGTICNLIAGKLLKKKQSVSLK